MKNFNERVNAVFAAMNTNYDEMNNLMQDVALGREIFDAETDRKISKAEANAKILEFSKKVLGITDIKDATEVKRAIRDNKRQWFDIIEDTVNVTVSVGLQESDWFNSLVETKTIGYHDRQDFYIEQDGILSVAKAGTSHHDHVLQRLSAGQTISIPTMLHVVKVGADINKYVTGQVDWAKFIDAITKAYIVDIQKEVYAQVAVAVSQLPANFKSTGTPLVKSKFDEIIENVSAANDGADVIVMGTRAGISAVASLSNVSWIADSQKENLANTGSIGIYEGTRLMVIPNRFADNTLTNKVFADQLLILPVIGDEGKFIKYVEEGGIEILEKSERGDYLSDLMTYEVQRRYGTGVVLGKKFGSWVL